MPTSRAFSITLDKAWMIKFVEHRVADRRILRLIQKWLTGWGDGGREMVGHGDRYSAGVGDLTAPCQYLSPL